MRRGGIVGPGGLLVLAMSSCAAPSIEELGRSAIREKAAEGKDWFTRFTETTDTTDRELVASRLEDRSFGHYAYGWDPSGAFPGPAEARGIHHRMPVFQGFPPQRALLS